MTKDELSHFARTLEDRKRSLQEVVEANQEMVLSELNVEEAAEPSKAPTHQADAAGNVSDQDKEFSLISMGQSELSEIEEALTRISNGSFGDCESCGMEIPLKRLNALPYTRFCIDCQEQLELKRRRASRLKPA